MKDKLCRVCGASFTPKSSRQLDCNQITMRTCKVCGKLFEAKCSKNDLRQACSAECTNQLGAINRYKDVVKYCEICGQPFTPKSNTQRYCKSIHEIPCKVCGKLFTTDLSVSEHAVTCSKECMLALRFKNGNPFKDPKFKAKSQKSYKETTGYDHPMHNPAVIERIKATNLERYGNDVFTRTDTYIQKSIATNLEKYGTNWPMQNSEIQQKAKQTLFENHHVLNPMHSQEIIQRFKENYLERTGYNHPANNPDVIDKRHQTNLERYGVEEAIGSTYVRDKSKQTNLERYGVEHAMQSPDIQAKAAQTNLERYGSECYLSSDEGKQKAHERFKAKYNVDTYSQLRVWKQARMTDPSKIDEWLKFLLDPQTYLNSLSDDITYHELELRLGVNSTTISYWIHLFGLEDNIKFTLSTGENDIVNILKDIDAEMQIKRHDRTTLNNKELDIMLPEHNIAIEFNPTVTHNSSLKDPWGGEPKYPRYHYDKSNECANKNIFLFHIFGYEWSYKQAIIISMLKNLLGKSTSHIYARNCEIRDVSTTEARQFLQNNHRQSATGASIRYGLYYDNNLVSLMTFSKMRPSIGTSSEDLSDCYELVRFCSALDTTVVGGASKLFKHFVNTISPKRVRSFSDVAHTRGSLYRTLGFNYVRTSDPGYVWVDTLTDIAYHRINAQKHNIKKFLHDNSIDLTKTEAQIMVEHGFVQVYDCGTILWEWRAD